MLTVLKLRVAYHAYARLCFELAPMLERLRALDANKAARVETILVKAITGGKGA